MYYVDKLLHVLFGLLPSDLIKPREKLYFERYFALNIIRKVVIAFIILFIYYHKIYYF